MVITVRHYARMLLARRDPGDVERARELVDEALATAHTEGMVVMARQLEELRAAAG
jgi:hypothetical protein